METSAAAITMGILTPGVKGNSEERVVSPPSSSVPVSLKKDIEELVNGIPFVDTHEHLLPEQERLETAGSSTVTPALDFGLLMSHYTDSDLQVAGMSGEDHKRLISKELSPAEKWKLVSPYYERCRYTGYQQCVREAVRVLYGEDDIRADNCERISRLIREGVRPGFYRRILREVSNIEYAQVNCLKSPVFRETETASDFLCFDLWTVGIASNVNLGTLNGVAGTEVTSLKQAHETIRLAFERYGRKAIAVKDQSAYSRRLNYTDVTDDEAAPIFERFVKGDRTLTLEERHALQNNLFRECLRLASEYNLPVKLHTGYAAGHGHMNLGNVRDNFTDIARLAMDFPQTKFVLMHIGYPYQQELIALCKHFPQIYADMCWAWIVDPASSTRFLVEFLMAAPASKLFVFGGDFIPVELVAGHARVARKGIARALAQLVEDDWLRASDVPALAERIMRGNAHEIYDLNRVLAAYSGS